MSTNQTAPQPEWYVEKRKKVEQRFDEENRSGEKTREFVSPSGRYKLMVESYSTGERSWNYTRGLFYRDGELIADVKRNYSSFPFCWLEGHPSGHDYVICSEDYQGVSVIELDTGRRVDYIPEDAAKGWGFCRAAYYPFPNDPTKIMVEGCFWACPYELRVADISDPMVLPWTERACSEHEGAEGNVRGFSADGTEFVTEESESVMEDGTPFHALPNEERTRILEDKQLYSSLVRTKVTSYVFS